MEFERKPRSDEDSDFIKWDKIGKVVQGRFLEYEKEAGKYKKPQLTLKVTGGKKKYVPCPKDLQDLVESNMDAIEGAWLVIKYVKDEIIEGRDNPMKVFSMAPGEPPKSGAKPDNEDPIPF
jgi:hypothetical protein